MRFLNAAILIFSLSSLSAFADAQIVCQFGDDGSPMDSRNPIHMTSATMTINEDAKTFHVEAHYFAKINSSQMTMDGILRRLERFENDHFIFSYELLKQTYTEVTTIVTSRGGPLVAVDNFPETLGELFLVDSYPSTLHFFESDTMQLFLKFKRSASDPIPADCTKL